MIYHLKFKYKFVYAVITLIIVIFSFKSIFRATSSKACSSDVAEPIDVVYTWVNGSDPLFKRALGKYTNRTRSKYLDASQTRYFDRHELKFSLRSLEKYAPWIRNVYILTNGQIPYWLNLDHENVFLVTHNEVFSNPKDLPTFSSPAIETHIHKIPGLSKKFLYFNDDIYLGAPIYPTDFYIPGRGYLIYLDYPVQNCAPDCPWIYVHDGQCDPNCNVSDCQMDGGDCDLFPDTVAMQDVQPPPPNVTYLYMMKTVSESSQNTTTLTTQLNDVIKRLAPNLERSSMKRLIETHNRNKILEEKVRRKKRKRQRPEIIKKYFDAYYESLQHTNRMFNLKYAFTPRHVPAHMPFLIDQDIVEDLQRKFRTEFDVTSSNRFRSRDDMQFSFSYFCYLISEGARVDIGTIFDEFDTDLSGTWSDREIRTVLTRLSELPLSTTSIDNFDGLLTNCSKIVRPKDVTTPEYERYIDSTLPTISKELVVRCEELTEILLERFGKRPKYLHEIIKNVSKYVSFGMIKSNLQSVVVDLDKIRKHPTKFVCINDNVYKNNSRATINAIWYDFYLSLFPLPSKFELPSEYRNRFGHVRDLRSYQMKMTFYLYCIIATCIFFIFYFLCKDKFIYLWKCRI